MDEKPNSYNEDIDTAGGIYIKGDVETDSDFTGRDKTVFGDEVGRDKIGGDQITGTINHPTSGTVIIGKDIQVTITERFQAEDATGTPVPGEPPFKGLQFFDVSDAGLFFGREQLTAELVAHLRHHRFLAVVGASGSGKSSVVRAGLVPTLQRGEPLIDGTQPPEGSTRWPVHIITPTTHPLKALAASLTQDSESVTATSTLIDDLASDARSLDLYVNRILSRRKAKTRSTNDYLVLVVDQFEELFTLCREKSERKAFVDNLLVAADTQGQTVVVLTLRADFYAHCSDFDNLRTALERYQRYIGPMNQAELRRAMEEPARLGGWECEQGLVDLMLQDAGDDLGTLPLLSHALLETWKRRHGHTLTLTGYIASGRVQGAIAKTAETIYQNLAPEQKDIAKNIYLRLTELGEGSQDTRRRVTLNELLPKLEDNRTIESVLKILSDARLITLFREKSSFPIDKHREPSLLLQMDWKIYVEVAHEALIREWPTLRRWLDDDREELRIHRRLTEAAQEWEKLGCDPGALYRGLRLEQTLEWSSTQSNQLNQLEQEFLNQSQIVLKEIKEEQEREFIKQRALERAKERQQLEVLHRQQLQKELGERDKYQESLSFWQAIALLLAFAVLVDTTWVTLNMRHLEVHAAIFMFAFVPLALYLLYSLLHTNES